MSQEIVWHQFPDQPGFVLGIERAFEGDSGVLFLRDESDRPTGTLLSDKAARSLTNKLTSLLDERGRA